MLGEGGYENMHCRKCGSTNLDETCIGYLSGTSPNWMRCCGCGAHEWKQTDLLEVIANQKDIFDGRTLVVTHPTSGTQWFCNQLRYALGTAGPKVAHESLDDPALIFVTYKAWDLAMWEHVYWLVREPIRVVYSMEKIYDKRPDIIKHVYGTLFGHGWRDKSDRALDGLDMALTTVLAFNTRARAAHLPVYRIEDVAAIEDDGNDQTHKPSTALWHRLYQRDSIKTRALKLQTLALNYPIRPDPEQRDQDLVSLKWRS